jgi:hypothetical protein
VPDKLDNSRNKRQSDSLFGITDQFDVFSGMDSLGKRRANCML